MKKIWIPYNIYLHNTLYRLGTQLGKNDKMFQ